MTQASKASQASTSSEVSPQSTTTPTGRTPEQIAEVVKAYDVRGLVGEQIDEDFVRDVGGSFAAQMRDAGCSRVVVGHDMRPSSPSFARAFAEGVTAQGLDVTLIGLCSTDQLYYASGALDVPGAMFTASHNPAAYNGIKMCRTGARPVGQETGLAMVAHDLVHGVPAYDGPAGRIDERDVLADYAAHLTTLVDLTGGRPLVVAVDAGNGMGGHTVPAVTAGLPLDVRPLYFELDGTFPNHEANPLAPENLVDLQRFVTEQGADVGLAFDGDADRCFVVDERGEPVSPSVITALVAERELAKHPGSTIIHNLITSRVVPELVSRLGGRPVRTRVGHSFIKATMAEEGAVFGGEHSAHYYFADFWCADSGMLAALHVLAALAEEDRPLSELMAQYDAYAQSGEINTRLQSAAEQQERSDAVVAHFEGRSQSIDRLDGVTVDLGEGTWFNLRASNTEPLLRLNVEAPTSEEVDAVVAEVLGVVRAGSGEVSPES